VPSIVRERASLTRWKRSKSRGSSLGWDPHAGVGHEQLRTVCLPAQRERDPAFEGVLKRVGKEVQDDLLPHIPVYEHGFGKRIALNAEREARRLDYVAEQAREVAPPIAGQADAQHSR
jgi:hypothetical protein